MILFRWVLKHAGSYSLWSHTPHDLIPFGLIPCRILFLVVSYHHDLIPFGLIPCRFLFLMVSYHQDLIPFGLIPCRILFLVVSYHPRSDSFRSYTMQDLIYCALIPPTDSYFLTPIPCKIFLLSVSRHPADLNCWVSYNAGPYSFGSHSPQLVIFGLLPCGIFFLVVSYQAGSYIFPQVTNNVEPYSFVPHTMQDFIPLGLITSKIKQSKMANFAKYDTPGGGPIPQVEGLTASATISNNISQSCSCLRRDDQSKRIKAITTYKSTLRFLLDNIKKFWPYGVKF
jgi:hypothetical protein